MNERANEFFILVYNPIDYRPPRVLRVREGDPAIELIPDLDTPRSLEVSKCALGDEHSAIRGLGDPVFVPDCEDLKGDQLVRDRVVEIVRTLFVTEDVELVVLLKHLRSE